MERVVLSEELLESLAQTYEEMERSYDQVAQAIGLSCVGCPDNCCDSYFEHHTYIEWEYLHRGVSELSLETQEKIFEKAQKYVVEAESLLQSGQRPQLMCPLNDNGLCLVYRHRLMVCRTHGVPAVITHPNGKTMNFPGCFRCQEKTEGKDSVPQVERTPMLVQLAALENTLLHHRRHLYPRVKLTIAQMLVKGPPTLPYR